jgi:hypothetical protein
VLDESEKRKRKKSMSAQNSYLFDTQFQDRTWEWKKDCIGLMMMSRTDLNIYMHILHA